MPKKFREVTKVYQSEFSGNHGNFTTSASRCTESQSILSTSHNPEYRRLGRTSSDVGGPFFSNKMKWSGTPSAVSLQGDVVPSNTGWKSRGVLIPPFVLDQSKVGVYGSESSLASWMPAQASEAQQLAAGATAISRVAPTNPVWDGATSLAELYSAKGFFKAPFANKDGHLPTSLSDLQDLFKPRGIAGEYLNLEFGVAPTASDILSLRDAAQESEKIIAQLERDSGKSIRRSLELPAVQVAESEGYQGTFPTFLGGGTPTAYEVGMGTMWLKSKTMRTQKFSGAFTYHLPPKGTWRRKIAELDAVYGIRPGIDTAWNAVPFSWLADYFGNAGDVLKNITSFAQDGLVLRYGYLTTVTETIWTCTWNYPIRRDGDRNVWSSYTGTMQCSFRTLNRMPANPFGFGPTGMPLTGRQQAIVAALGVSLRK